MNPPDTARRHPWGSRRGAQTHERVGELIREGRAQAEHDGTTRAVTGAQGDVALVAFFGVTEDDVDAVTLEKEKEILRAQALESGKPAEIVEKMMTGRIRKYLAEITLVGQPFVKDPDKTVGVLLSEADATDVRFIRYEVGEGIEKKVENFAEEVMAQVGGS